VFDGGVLVGRSGSQLVMVIVVVTVAGLQPFVVLKVRA
jgi:hypothetical protein